MSILLLKQYDEKIRHLEYNPSILLTGWYTSHTESWFYYCQAQVQVQVRWRSGEGQEGQSFNLSYTLFLVFTYRLQLPTYRLQVDIK